MPRRMPPIITTIFGPKRSTNHPSTGTSQVSVNTKMLKATWIAARPQWYLASIGKTNSVQPYCRLVIITMQTMPKASCSQRNGEGRATAARASIVMSLPLPAFLVKVVRDRLCRLSSFKGVGLHRALNLKQRLYRLISPNSCTRAHGKEAIINNAKLTRIVNVTLPRRRALAFVCGWFAAGSLAFSAVADDKPGSAEPPQRVETRHSTTLGNHSLDYRAIAETIGLTDQKGEPSASIFTVSYLAEPAAGERRPVAFVFNGGPGAASVFLHLGALGPRILDTPATGAA